MKNLRVVCPICGKDFGQEKRFVEHIADEHNITDSEQFYIDTHLDGVAPLCKCGCGRRVKFNSWKLGYLSEYVRGHNAVIDRTFARPDVIAKNLKLRREKHERGELKVWNRGLTKENCEKLRTASEKTSRTLKEGYKTGRFDDWRKNDPEKLKLAGRKSSETKKKKFSEGTLVSWNQGLTKETDPRLQKIAANISARWTPERREKLAEKNGIAHLLTHHPNFELITPIGEYVNKHQILEFRCRACGNIQKKSLMHLKATPTCFACHPNASKGQLEVYEYVKTELGIGDAILCDRTAIKPREIDILCKDQNFGIEFNGLWFHSEKFVSQQLMQLKFNMIRSSGVDVLTIFDNEWREKCDIVKGMIAHRLGKSKNRIGARQCTVVQLTSADEFFDTNHLDGSTKSVVTFALMHGDMIVAAMSVRKPFHKKWSADRYEIARACPKLGWNVSGWLGKLTKAALKWSHDQGMVGLMTYADMRLTQCPDYTKCGWQLHSETGPKFWWTNGCNVWNRFKFRANKRLGKSEREVADEMGVVKVWIPGNFVYTLT